MSPRHTFETAHSENMEFALSDRRSFQEIQEIHSSIQANDFAASILEKLPMPAVIASDSRQIVFANAAAISMVHATAQSDVLGLRLGEFFGIDHAFHGKACGAEGGCADCNSMESVILALKGEGAHEEGHVAMFPEDESNSARYSISTAPLALGGHTLAAVFFQATE